MPMGRGVDPMIDYLGCNLGNEECVRCALQHLASMTKDDVPEVDGMSKNIILRAMNDYIGETDIVVAGLNVLNNLLVTGKCVIFLSPASDIPFDILHILKITNPYFPVSKWIVTDFAMMIFVTCQWILKEIVNSVNIQSISFQSYNHIAEGHIP